MPERLVIGEFVLASKVVWASSWRARARGLKDVGRPGACEALVLTPAHQVHTFGLDFDIDVVFCDRKWMVIGVVRRMPPRRVTRLFSRARYVVELRAGAIPAWLREGARVEVVDSNASIG